MILSSIKQNCKICSAINSSSELTRTINLIYIYIYILSLTTRLFRCIPTFQRGFKLGSKPAQRYVRLRMIPLSHEASYVSWGIYNALCINFPLFTSCFTGYQSFKFIRRAYCKSKVTNSKRKGKLV